MVKIVYAFFYAISLLPFRLLYCIADFEYFMMYYVIKYRRGIVRKNLTTSFPEKSEEEIVDIEKKFYRWFSDYFFEAVKLLSISDKELRRRFKVYNSEEVEQCFQEGQDVAAILGHYCNWEWLSCVGIKLPKTRIIGLIYHPLRNQAFDELFKRIRSHEENGVPVPKKDILRYLVDYKRKNIRSSAFCVLTAARAAYSLVVLWAAVAACHNDFATVQGSIEGFQLVNQFGRNQSFMVDATAAPKFPDVEMWGKLGAIVIIIMIDWHNIILSQKIFLEKFEKTLDNHQNVWYNRIMERG